MKHVIVFLQIFCLCCFGGNPQQQLAMLSRKKASSTYLVKENFETTGTPPGWTAGLQFDYTTSPAPLEGSESAYNNIASSCYKTFPDRSDVWVYGMYRITSLGSQDYIFSLSNGATNVARIRYLSTGAVRATDSGTNVANSGAGVLAINTTYHIWMRYIKGSGSNSQTILYFSTTGTRGSAVATLTTGNGSLDANRLTIACANSTSVIFDKIRVSSSEIGDSPL